MVCLLYSSNIFEALVALWPPKWCLISLILVFFHQSLITHIVLIPKVKEPKIITEYKSISLCNVVYKIASKAIANRLKKILPSVLVAFETMHHICQDICGTSQNICYVELANLLTKYNLLVIGQIQYVFNTSRNKSSSLVLNSFELVQETSEEVLFIKAPQIA